MYTERYPNRHHVIENDRVCQFQNGNSFGRVPSAGIVLFSDAETAENGAHAGSGDMSEVTI